MLIENNMLLKIDKDDIIDGVFTAPDDVFFVKVGLECYNVDKIILPNVVRISDNFLYFNNSLKYLEMPKVEYIGDWFLFYNNMLTHLEIPSIKKIDDGFLFSNSKYVRTREIIKSITGSFYIGGQRVDKKEYLRKLNIDRLLK